MIVHATENQLEDVAALALKLFTQTGGDTIHKEMRAILSDGNAAIFLHYTEEGVPAGFAQCQLRFDYVEGTRSSPVGYLEGIFVEEPSRNKALRKNCSGGQRLGQRKRAVRNLPAIASWGTRKAYPFTKALVFGKQTASSVLRSSCDAGPGDPP